MQIVVDDREYEQIRNLRSLARLAQNPPDGIGVLLHKPDGVLVTIRNDRTCGLIVSIAVAFGALMYSFYEGISTEDLRHEVWTRRLFQLRQNLPHWILSDEDLKIICNRVDDFCAMAVRL